MADFVFSAFADEIDSNFETQLISLNKLDIPLIELRGVNGKNFTTLTDDEVEDVKKLLNKYGIKVWALGSPIGKAVTNCSKKAQLDLLYRVMEIGDKLDVKRIRMFSYYPEEGDSFEVFEEKAFDLISALLDEAEKRGFILCHENEKDIYGYSPVLEKKMLDHFGGRLKAVLDNGNFPFCGQSAKGAYGLLKDYIEYFHIKDCDSEGVIVPPGFGDACLEETLKEINADRQGKVVITMEPHLINFTGLSSLSKLDDIKHKFSFNSPYEAFEYATSCVRRMIEGL
ncbi:MAG: sugar phosphate isomerase/epimerase family protein [Eubacteriales bacterium]|jgi:sugar phosphate isomerase/epimerase